MFSSKSFLSLEIFINLYKEGTMGGVVTANQAVRVVELLKKHPSLDVYRKVAQVVGITDQVSHKFVGVIDVSLNSDSEVLHARGAVISQGSGDSCLVFDGNPLRELVSGKKSNGGQETAPLISFGLNKEGEEGFSLSSLCSLQVIPVFSDGAVKDPCRLVRIEDLYFSIATCLISASLFFDSNMGSILSVSSWRDLGDFPSTGENYGRRGMRCMWPSSEGFSEENSLKEVRRQIQQAFDSGQRWVLAKVQERLVYLEPDLATWISLVLK
jgi:hypothetical protein